jgi:hypothetical protein
MSKEAILRSRAMMISGRLLSNDNMYMFIDESSKTYPEVLELIDFHKDIYLKKLHFSSPIVLHFISVYIECNWSINKASCILHNCEMCIF